MQPTYTCNGTQIFAGLTGALQAASRGKLLERNPFLMGVYLVILAFVITTCNRSISGSYAQFCNFHALVNNDFFTMELFSLLASKVEERTNCSACCQE